MKNNFKTKFKTPQSGTIVDNALLPNPGIARDVISKKVQEKQITELIKNDKRKYKNFKFGVGVGP